MADLTITASQVQPGDINANTKEGTAGASITAGQPLYADASAQGKLKPADADLSSAAATCVGIAVHAAESGQPIRYQRTGDITLGAAAAMTAGTIYVVSDTAGGIMPSADLEAGDRVSILGVAISASVLRLRLLNSDVAVPA